MSSRISSGCMYMYEAAQVITIDAVSQYHPVIGLGQDGMNNGVTYLAHATGSITDTEDNGSTLLRCTDVGHNLTTGQKIALTGMGDVAHAGFTSVTVITADVFDCDNISWNSDSDTGTWTRGSSLTVGTGHGGIYVITFSASILSAANNKNYRFEFVKNVTPEDTIAVERKIAVLNDLGSISTGGLTKLVGGDVIWVSVKGTTDATNLSIEHMNVHMVRL